MTRPQRWTYNTWLSQKTRPGGTASLCTRTVNVCIKDLKDLRPYEQHEAEEKVEAGFFYLLATTFAQFCTSSAFDVQNIFHVSCEKGFVNLIIEGFFFTITENMAV